MIEPKKNSSFIYQISSTFVLRCPIFYQIASETLHFYADWTIQMLLTAIYLATIITILSFYVGISLYVRAMVADLAARMNNEDGASEASLGRLIGEIKFHTEVLE